MYFKNTIEYNGITPVNGHLNTGWNLVSNSDSS